MTGLPNENSLFLCYWTATLGILAVFAVYDWKYHKIRNRALLLFLPWCLLSIPLAFRSSNTPFPTLLLQSGLGFLSGGLVLFFAAWMTQGGIGGGDIKLSALLGIPFPTEGVCRILLFSALTALLFFLCRPAKDRPHSLPFAPFLLWGVFLTIIL